MRLGVFAVVFSVLIAGGACGGSSSEGLFSSGGSSGAGSSSGGSAATGAESGSAGIGGTEGTGTLGSAGTAGTFGGTGGSGGSMVDADVDVGTGGTTDSGRDGGGTNGASGSRGSGGGGGNGVVCEGMQCERQCCITNTNTFCSAAGAECGCTGLGCTPTTSMSCDSQSDCTGGEICCITVVFTGLTPRVSNIRCQASCPPSLTQYVLCEPNSPDVCSGGLTCQPSVLMPSISACQ